MKYVLLILGGLASLPLIAKTAKKTLKPTDLYKQPTLMAQQLSPDCKWVVYELSEVDTAKDKRVSHLWMQSFDGKQSIQLTYGDEPASTPKWTPDGKFISYLSEKDSKNG